MKKLISLFTFIMFSCASSTEETLDIQLPEQTNDGWKVSSLQAENIDAKKINEILNLIETNPLYKNIHSLSIARNGKLVYDHYFSDRLRDQYNDPYNHNSVHHISSCTKSFTSTLIGILIERGNIESVDASVQSLLPESLNIDWSGGKENISLKHLLTMSSGISGADDTDLPISQTPNHSEYFFNLPLAHEPGTKNVYRSASSSTFRDIIAHVTNRPNTLDVYKELLFRPLGISKFEWYGRNSNNHIQSAGHLMLKPRDMMKLGQLYLDKGVWNGKRVVSEAWVKEVITERFDRSKIDAWARNLYHLDGYGYQWWMNDYVVDGQTVKAYQACGQGGQYIVVIPSLNAVINFTSWYDDGKDFVHPLNLIENYILSSLN